MVLVLLKNAFFPSRASDLYESRHDLDLESRKGEDSSRSSLNISEASSETIYRQELLSSNEKDEELSSTTSIRPINPRTISDAILGLSDGLTVPFALCAGLSALGDSKVVILGGMAELTAGAISMGLGGWMAARTESEAYQALLASTKKLIKESPQQTSSIVGSAIRTCIPEPTSVIGISKSQLVSQSVQIDDLLTRHVLNTGPDQILSFIMTFYHRTSPPSDTRSALTSAATIAAAYFFGGFIPLLPYFFLPNVTTAFWWSVCVVCIALFTFGAGRSYYVNISAELDAPTQIPTNEDDVQYKPFPGQFKYQERRHSRLLLIGRCITAGIQMLLLGMTAACAAMGFVKVFNM